MKIQHKIICSVLAFSTVVGAVSCKKGFDEINKPYKDAIVSTATPASFFNNLAMRATEEDYTLYTGLFMPITNQQGVQNTQINVSNYVPNYWTNYYKDLTDYRQLLQIISVSSNPTGFNNVKDMATILISYKTLSMLDRYGDIPYSEAALAPTGTQFYRPKYDKQEDVYKKVLADLEAAVTEIGGANQVSIDASEALLANDFVAWKKFGNAIRLRYALRLYNTNLQTVATKIIGDVVNNASAYPLPNNQNLANLNKSNYGNYPLIVVPTTSYVDRYWYAFRETSVSNIRMSSNVWNQVSATNADDGSGIFDPRCKVWFMPNNAGKWVPQPQNGLVRDGGNPYPNQDSGSPKAPGTDPENKFASFNFYLVRDYLGLPYVLISEADVHFLMAEVYNRGIGGVAKSEAMAKTEYEAGIKASVDFWYQYANTSPNTWVSSARPGTLAPAQMTAFLAQANVAFVPGDDAGNYKKIITQSWLADLFQSNEAWCTVRRTGLTPKDATYNPAVYNRLPYPDDERVNNFANWNTATNGADAVVQAQKKVYWMP